MRGFNLYKEAAFIKFFLAIAILIGSTSTSNYITLPSTPPAPNPIELILDGNSTSKKIYAFYKTELRQNDFKLFLSNKVVPTFNLFHHNKLTSNSFKELLKVDLGICKPSQLPVKTIPNSSKSERPHSIA